MTRFIQQFFRQQIDRTMKGRASIFYLPLGIAIIYFTLMKLTPYSDNFLIGSLCFIALGVGGIFSGGGILSIIFPKET